MPKLDDPNMMNPVTFTKARDRENQEPVSKPANDDNPGSNRSGNSHLDWTSVVQLSNFGPKLWIWIKNILTLKQKKMNMYI